MKKISFLAFSTVLIIGCFGRGTLFPVFIWIAAATYFICVVWYAYAVLKGKTQKFHECIGWCWMVPAIPFSLWATYDEFTNWNRIVIFIIGLCLGCILVRLWIDDKNTKAERVTIFGVGASVLLAATFLFCIMGINESVIRDYRYTNIEVTDKEYFESTQSFFDQTSYYISFEYEKENLKIDMLQVSKEYYETLDVGSEVPICICTGLFGKKFYFLYEEPDPKWDYYGLNEWAREKAQEEQIQIE